MTALGFSEHGNIFNFFEKKQKIEQAGLKYIHGVECYITEDIENKVRDNRHCVLMARNYDGFLEINKLVSNSYNRDDGHFYYTPRITLDELIATSDNIFVTTACIAGILGDATKQSFKDRVIEFFSNNKDRCFLEVQHHCVDAQREHNTEMSRLSDEYGLQIIAGTDTHSLNAELAEARVILQNSKHVRFDNEDGWDLTFKAYDELAKAFRAQGVLPEEKIQSALNNTNALADMIEPFKIDTNPKYPKLYDDSVPRFREMVYNSITSHPYALQNHTREELERRIEEELPIYEQTGTIDFMLFQKAVRDWEHANNIYVGYGRGSVTGSMIAYLLQITEMDSLRFDLNMFRFLNPDRVTNCDIDSDYYDSDREKVLEFLLTYDKIRSAKIITFQTIALKGAIRDVGRALGMPLSDVDKISKSLETDEMSWRKKYPKLFYYVDLLNGVIVGSGTHAAGVLCASVDIDALVGTCTSKDTPFRISCLDMYGVDGYGLTKFDCLGLDNVGIVNKTCELAGIDRVTPDNIDLNDQEVWDSIRDDTSMIFQWESSFAGQIAKRLLSDPVVQKAQERLPNLSMLKLFSFGNGLIRPGCASFRDEAANGVFHDNGLDELNNLLAYEFGYLSMQETIMRFLVQFCGYSHPESDTVRRAIAKKKGTEKLLPEIRRRFVEYTSAHFGVPVEKCEEIIEPFIVSILNASDYGFSWNHSDAYSAIGYACGYLRYHYPLEFLTTCLNIYKDKEEKTGTIVTYCNRHKIKLLPIKFGKSKADYFMDRANNAIYKGCGSVKYMNGDIANALYDLAQNKQYTSFVDLLIDVKQTGIDARQLEILTYLDYFSDFGNSQELWCIIGMCDFMKWGAAKSIAKDKVDESSDLYAAIEGHSSGVNAKGKELKMWQVNDAMAILHDMEIAILNRRMPDFDLSVKLHAQSEYLGHIASTGRDEDRALLIVKDVYPLFRKKDGKQFGYSIITTSIGSGMQSRFTIFNKVFEQCGELQKNDIIRCLDYERDGQYFRMTKYTII